MAGYTIKGEGFEATRSSKASAIALADATRSDLKVDIEVTTSAGTVVHVAKTRAPGKRTPRFTRIDARDVSLGEGVKIPKGWDVAYARPRSSLLELRKVTDEGATYVVFDAATGARSDEVATTRAAGAIMRDVRKGDLTLTV